MRVAKAAIIAILFVLAAVLAAALVIAWPVPEFSEPSTSAEQSDKVSEESTAPTLAELKTPLDIAGVFGYTPPVAPPPKVIIQSPPEVPPPPPVADWIQSIGFITSGDGMRRYVLKLKRPRDTIVSLAIGESDGGLLLVAVENTNLVIEQEGERYLVPLPRR